MSGLLPIRMVAKPWGKDVLPAPFVAPVGQRIGEVWFEPPAALPGLLVKYLFTSEKLSVQVHPSDAQTIAQGLGHQGKTECWLVIGADPGAALGIGFGKTLDADQLRAAALDGSIEQLLEWIPVRSGDFFYIPANTVHAIGAGISLIEVQQNSDITYRLFDYGRPRELHLDAGIAVAQGQPHDPALRRQLAPAGSVSLVDGPLFRLDRLDGAPDPATMARYGGSPVLVIPMHGEIEVGGETVRPGQCALAHALQAVKVPPGTLALIVQDCAQPA